MADRKTMTALSKQTVTVPAYSVQTLNFLDSKPNYFRVQNSGEAKLYCATGSYPTVDNYDFMVKPNSLMAFAEPFSRHRLHIYNPSGSPIIAHVLTFQAEFDPLVLALGNIEIEMPNSIESTSVISSFNASLPTGTNHLGSVDVSNQKDYTTILNSILTACNSIVNKLTDAESTGY